MAELTEEKLHETARRWMALTNTKYDWEHNMSLDDYLIEVYEDLSILDLAAGIRILGEFENI